MWRLTFPKFRQSKASTFNWSVPWLLLGLCRTAVIVAAEPDPRELLKEADRLFWLDNFPKAQPLFHQAESAFDAAGDQRNALYARIGRLRADGDRTGYPAVSHYIAGQLGSPLVLGDARLRLRCLIVKASIDLSIDPASSTETWIAAERLANELNEPGWANRAKAELAIIAFLKGNTQEAQKSIADAIMKSMLLGDLAGQVRQLSLVAVGLGELGLNDRALRYADQALKIAAANPDVRYPLMANMAKMKSLEALGRPEEAERLLASILDFVESTGMAVYRSDVLLAVAIREDEKGKTDDAIRHLRQAVESADAVGMPRPAASALFRLAQIYERQGNIAQAEATIDRAVETTRQLVDMYILPRQLATAAEIKVRASKPQAAAELFDEAADLIDAMLVNVPTAGLRASLIAVMSEVYEGYSDLALRQLRDPVRAFTIIERARGRAAVEALRNSSPESVPTNTQAAREVVRIQVQLQTVRTPRQRRELLAKLAEAEEHLMSDLRPTAIGLPSAQRTEPIALSALQDLLRPSEVVLEYVLGEPSSHAFVISKGSFAAIPLPSRSKIETAAREVLHELKARAAAPVAQLRALSAILLPAAALNARRLIVVPDGVLHAFPFDALSGNASRDLSETHTLSYAPSATSLAILRSRPQSRIAADRLPVLAVGAVGVRDQDMLAESTVQRFRTARGMFDATLTDLPILPASEREVESVRATFGRGSVVLKRAAATESAFKRQPVQRFNILHLAVHGVVDAKFPERSALVLAPSPAEHEDGLLQIREISTMRLTADLVTLSACDTSLGRVEGQEGVASFVRAFLQAGARNIVSALWEVDDSISAKLMERFYVHLSRKFDVAEAMHLAKADLRRRYGRANSVLWLAPWVVTGE
jgi:tetratricopeptide (TPR) repeat protein